MELNDDQNTKPKSDSRINYAILSQMDGLQLLRWRRDLNCPSGSGEKIFVNSAETFDSCAAPIEHDPRAGR